MTDRNGDQEELDKGADGAREGGEGHPAYEQPEFELFGESGSGKGKEDDEGRQEEAIYWGYEYAEDDEDPMLTIPVHMNGKLFLIPVCCASDGPVSSIQWFPLDLDLASIYEGYKAARLRYMIESMPDLVCELMKEDGLDDYLERFDRHVQKWVAAQAGLNMRLLGGQTGGSGPLDVDDFELRITRACVAAEIRANEIFIESEKCYWKILGYPDRKEEYIIDYGDDEDDENCLEDGDVVDGTV